MEFAARARSASEVTPQVLMRAADRVEGKPGSEAAVESEARRTALMAARPIQWAEPSSLIANPQPPGADRGSLLAAAVGKRSRAGIDNHTWAGIERSLEGDLHVAKNVDRRGENLSQGAADSLSQFWTCSPGPSHARARNLRGRNAGGGAGLAHRLLQRLAGLRFTDADNVAWSGSRGREQARFIAYRAGGFGAASVDAEIVGHGYF